MLKIITKEEHKVKKAFMALLIACAMVAGCGTTQASNSQQAESSKEQQEQKDAPGKSKVTLGQKQEETEEETAVAVEETEEKIKSTEATEKAETQASGDIKIDSYDMKFYINGAQYTMGETKLSDLINNGVEFDNYDETDTVEAGYVSKPYKINVADDWSAFVEVMNESDEVASAADCIVCGSAITMRDGKTQDVMSYDFPLNMTEDELRQAAGDPTNESTYSSGDYTKDTLEYTHEPEKYYGDCGYTFEFKNGQLQSVSLDWLP